MRRLKYLPKRWNKADVILLVKTNNDEKFLQNYRPISILLAISKIVERIIFRRGEESTEELGILSSAQFGVTTRVFGGVTIISTDRINNFKPQPKYASCSSM